MVISVWDDTWMGFTRAEQASQWEQDVDSTKYGNKSYESTGTINTIGGDLVGPVKHLPAEPLSYPCNVYCASISGMGGT